MIVTTNERLPKLSLEGARRGSHRPTLAIHGGAGPAAKPNIPKEQEEAYRAALRRSLAQGNAILEAGGSALDAACAAVASMEDDALFNSGHGAVFNKAGFNELEASVMVAQPPPPRLSPLVAGQADAQRNRRCASAILVRNTRNPIMLAKALLQSASKNPHVILSGRTAEEIGWSAGCDRVDSSYYYTRERWLEHRRELGLPDEVDPGRCDGASRSTSDLSEGTTALDAPPSYGSLEARSNATPSLVFSSSRATDDEKEEGRSRSSSSIDGDGDVDGDSIVMTPSGRNSIDDDVRGDLGMEGLWTFDWHGGQPGSTLTRRDAAAAAGQAPAEVAQEQRGPLDWRPTGTVGAVALDADGNLACATSTGGITNKLPGRIGDTPTPGAGFWAEYWHQDSGRSRIIRHDATSKSPEEADGTSRRNKGICFPSLKWLCGVGAAGNGDGSDFEVAPQQQQQQQEKQTRQPSPALAPSMSMDAASRPSGFKGVALSGTGTGDYFLRSSFASLLVHRMRFLGEDIDQAGRHAIDEMGHLGGVGGAICIDEAGRGALSPSLPLCLLHR